ncbi:hypothetical protein ACRALDRAFT_2019731 [Sodiomyces alcalophilus JCM 7366]|uniref:uncharacterized protein n=1 Tax=Sodiomyces alcalophilus JCM 7366 TaxID=591952 RepID=UPI0039B63923
MSRSLPSSLVSVDSASVDGFWLGIPDPVTGSGRRANQRKFSYIDRTERQLKKKSLDSQSPRYSFNAENMELMFLGGIGLYETLSETLFGMVDPGVIAPLSGHDNPALVHNVPTLYVCVCICICAVNSLSTLPCLQGQFTIYRHPASRTYLQRMSLNIHIGSQILAARCPDVPVDLYLVNGIIRKEAADGQYTTIAYEY